MLPEELLRITVVFLPLIWKLQAKSLHGALINLYLRKYNVRGINTTLDSQRAELAMIPERELSKRIQTERKVSKSVKILRQTKESAHEEADMCFKTTSKIVRMVLIALAIDGLLRLKYAVKLPEDNTFWPLNFLLKKKISVFYYFFVSKYVLDDISPLFGF